MAEDEIYVLSDSDTFDDGLPDNDVDGMIRDIVAKKPELSKWMVMSPELMKRKGKQQQQKQKRDEKKRKRQEEADSDDDDSDAPKRKKKDKQKEETLDYPIVPITGYVHVIKPITILPKTRTTKPLKPESTYIKRGPFQFMSNCSFDDFLALMAEALPCPPANIVLDKTEWKPQTPANRAPLPLGSAVGFSVLRTQISKTKDKIVIISMPGPRKPTEDALFWDTGDANVPDAAAEAGPSTTKKEFDFAELEATNTEESVAEQKMSFDKAIAPHIEALKDHWPENDAGKRIYTDDKGYKWELTTIRLNVWGAHMARGSATVNKPPASTQFDIKYRLKGHTPAVVPPPTTNPASIVPAPAPTPTSASEKLLELAVSMMLSQQQHHHPQQTSVPVQALAPPPLAALPLINQSPVPSAPPSPAKHAHRAVSLQEFCAHYGIEQYVERLEKLEYEPGDSGITSLGRDDWQILAGFPKLAWDRVLSKHKQFLKDVQAGLWS